VNSAKMLKEILSSKVSTWSGCPQFVEFVFSDNFYCENKETWLKNIRYCAVKSLEILMTKNPTHPLQLFFVKLLFSDKRNLL
jgi:hypothetical protein